MQPAKLGAMAIYVATGALLGMLVLAPSSSAQSVLETPQQTNDRIRELSSSARLMPHDYIIGDGDVLTIDVFDVKELSRDVRVSQTGSIGIPLVPVRIRVSGLTELQAEQKIAEILQADGLVSNAQVSVAVRDRRSKPITIVGAVGHSMVYQADHPVTLLEVLAEAGGIANDAGDTVIVTRKPTPTPDLNEPPSIGPEDPIPSASSTTHNPADPVANSQTSALPGTSFPTPPTTAPPLDPASNPPPIGEPPALSNTITVNLNELVESGNATNNIILQAGDIVSVPHAGIVYVLGAVGKPGGFVLANDRNQFTALKILALAGGMNPTAKSDKAVIVRRDEHGKQYEVNVDLKKVLKRETEDVQLRASDILYVPNSAAKAAVLKTAELALAVGTGIVLYRLAYH